MMGFDVIGRLLGSMRDRDGQARALEDLTQAQPGPPGPRAAPNPAEEIYLAVATKVLSGWLANRQQTLVPHTLNFRVLERAQADLLLAVMAAAAQADGEIDSREVRQLPLALRRVGAGEDEARRLDEALAEPQHLGVLLARVQEAGLGTHAYAAALLAINRGARANRAFLDYLGARLGLAPEVAGSLERRYRA
ncbi:putative membrane protein [Rubellimicrobium mesophilum DSM 19309]|uniref:Putative membrane protein n=1 Tax=Rubellimicrobium mesophilum DSM 19309 TaxID=442562 RepID=A0A017HJR3_9RHOB|nr:DUF533 domain-containing protein [Rubellimicrobium mesophilum]EYD74757.1 putative membrane protein [Rubellimicrobium mesophilum DSM 19309]